MKPSSGILRSLSLPQNDNFFVLNGIFGSAVILKSQQLICQLAIKTAVKEYFVPVDTNRIF
jgi:hypothetical protein